MIDPTNAPTHRRRRVVIAAASAAALVAVVAGSVVATRYGDSTVEISGSVHLSRSQMTTEGGSCRGRDGFDDLAGGAQVLVTSATGETIGVGRLDAGDPQYADGTTAATECILRFAVEVPGGHDFYGVEVSGRGRLQYPADEAVDGIRLVID